MRNYLFAILFILFSASSCSVLTKSESKQISNFATSMQDFSTLPPKINDIYYQWKLESQRLSVVSGLDSNFKKHDYLTVDKQYTSETITYDSIVSKIDTFCSLIVKISKTINLLTDQSYLTNFNHKADTLSINLDTAISNLNKIEDKKLSLVGGNLLGGFYKAVVKYRMRKLQRKYLVEFFDNITPVIDTIYMYRDYVFIRSKDVEDEEITRHANENNFVLLNANDIANGKYHFMDFQAKIWFNSIVLSGLSSYYTLTDIIPKNEAAFLKMKNSMDKLDRDIHNKKLSAKDLFNDTKDFISDANNLSNTFKKYQSGKTSK